ncbi:terminase small subunit [Aminobacterium mobile]|uniref:terminase small subunit n=1 Tax=Aminobacterium mobile TaxID=81467 RepID=UPI002FD94186
MAKLTTKQKAFIQSYCGNATEAALKAGYSKKTARSIGNENLTKPHIIAAIKKREEKRTNNRIATREERQIFWTQTMKDEKADMRDRLRASELLGKSEADFMDKIEHSGALEGVVVLPAVQIAGDTEAADEE